MKKLIEYEASDKEEIEISIHRVIRAQRSTYSEAVEYRIIPQSAEPVASGENYNTSDADLDLLLGLTDDIVSGKFNMDTAIWWQQTLAKVIERLHPITT